MITINSPTRKHFFNIIYEETLEGITSVRISTDEIISVFTIRYFAHTVEITYRYETGQKGLAHIDNILITEIFKEYLKY